MSTGTMLGREPVAILFAVMAVIQVAIAFGVTISAEQLGLLNVALAAIFSVITRSQVTPV